MPPFSEGEKKGVSMRKGILCFGLVVAAACGGGTNNNNGSQDMAPIQAPTEDLAGTPGRDGGGGGGGDMTGMTGIPEAEPVNMRTNDTATTAEALPLGMDLDGTSGDVANGQPDIDYFKFTANAGDVMRLTLSARGDFQPFAVVLSASDPDYFKRALSNGATSTTRQFYIPRTGEYRIVVLDDRNRTATDPAALVGGANFTYRLKVEKQTVTPTPIMPPVNAQAGMLAADNDVKIFSISTVAGQFYRAQVVAQGLTPASDLDPALYFVDATAGAANQIAFVEDNDGANGDYDATAAGALLNPGTLHIVLDHYETAGPNTKYELTVLGASYATETEPNGSPGTATFLPTPGMTDTVTSAGAINSTGTTQTGDTDLFSISAAAGDVFEITVAQGTSSPMIPAIGFFDPSQSVYFRNVNRVNATTARLEAHVLKTGVHQIGVFDARNLTATAGSYVGGAAYTYTLTVKRLTRTVTAAGTQGKIDVGGKYLVYDLSIAGGTKLVWIDGDLSTHAGVNGFALKPTMLVVNANGTVVAGGARVFLRDLFLPVGNYTLFVGEEDGRSSANNHGFLPRVLSIDANGITDDGTHTTRQTALPVGGDAAIVDGNLTAGGAAWFSLGTLAADSAVTLVTGPQPNGPATDTRISLLDSTGTAVATNDDIDSFNRNYWSQLIRARIPSAGEYFVRVDGGTSSAAGLWRLSVIKGQCPAATGATPSLFINEAMSQPGMTGGDANGDGTSSSVDDEFVEIVNISGPAAIGGWSVRDGSGARFRASCGATLASGAALTVFGGCDAGQPACATTTTANTDPANPRSSTMPSADRLGLDDGGDVVLLTNYDGRIIDRVVLGAATQNVSFARGTAATCDAQPTSEAVQLHTACTAQVGGRSPGKKADGTAFMRAPNKCDLATAVSSGTPVTGDTSTATAQFGTTGGGMCTALTYTFDGSELFYKITIPANQELTVTVTPDAGSGYDPAIAIVTDCAAVEGSCLAAVDNELDNDPETVTYRNATANPLEVRIVVDTYTAGSEGPFTLTATLAP
jgi:hypothetical protein